MLRLLPLPDVRRGEWAGVILAALYHFCLLAAYYIIRPIRDEIAANNRDSIATLWTLVFFVMLVVVPLYALLTKHVPRRWFIPLVNGFFAACLVLFAFGLRMEGEIGLAIDFTFYVWASVFNLFVVAVFWSFMANLFHHEQGRRLFGLIAVGGTLGAMSGGLFTGELIQQYGVTLLLLGGVGFLCAATCCFMPLERGIGTRGPTHEAVESAEAARARGPVRGSIINGLLAVVRSPYLLAICGFLFLYTCTSSFLYFEKSQIVGLSFDDRELRTQLLARADVAVNLLTLFGQGLVFAWVLRRIGVGLTLLALPLVTLIGFLVLGVALEETYETLTDEAGAASARLAAVGGSALTIVIGFDVLRRASNFVLAKPTREVLFTLVSRQEKYQSKVFIDTVVYRGGDMVSGWAFEGLKALGLTLAAIALTAVPIAALWGGLALLLGRSHDRRARRENEPSSES